MPVAHINDDEYEALRYLPHETRSLYLMLRMCADANGMAGLSRRISRRMILEWLEVRPEWGSKAGDQVFTWDQARRRLDQLQRAQLIEKQENSNLVFRLPKATRDKSVQKRMTRGRHDDDTVSPPPRKANNANGSEGVIRPMMTRGRHAEDDTTSPVTIYTSSQYSKTSSSHTSKPYVCPEQACSVPNAAAGQPALALASPKEGRPADALLSLPTNKRGEEWSVNDSDVEEWKAAYPAVDVVAELRRMRAWLDANPRRRKTRRGMKAFVVNWLSREQDRGGRDAAAAGKGNYLEGVRNARRQ